MNDIPISESWPLYAGIIGLALLLLYTYASRAACPPFGSQNGFGWAFVLVLFASAFAISFFAGTQHDFLHYWDEQYHVAVAGNMAAGSFLTPRLFPDELPTVDHLIWINCGVWLHKPPLFMWQIALSLLVFGKTVIGIRLPSIIMSALATVAMYGIGKRLFGKEVGIWAAVLFITNFYWLMLVAGHNTCDANDVAFIAYVVLSVWAWLSYWQRRTTLWAVATGAFAAAAILTKWYLGLWAIGAWFLALVFQWVLKQKPTRREWIHFGTAVGVALLPAVVWTVYINVEFPVQAKYESEYSLRHLYEAIEGHSGGAWFHFRRLSTVFSGELVPLVLVLAVAMLAGYSKRKPARLAFIGLLVTTVVFFTAVQTKMESFMLQAAPGVFVALAFLAVKGRQLLCNRLKWRWTGALLFVGVMVPAMIHHIDFGQLNSAFRVQHQDNEHTVKLRQYRHQFAQIGLQLEGRKAFVLGVPYSTEAMFYFYSGQMGSSGFQTPEKRRRITELGYQLYVFPREHVPEDVRNDTTILMLPNVQLGS